jgi:hypothetical protein
MVVPAKAGIPFGFLERGPRLRGGDGLMLGGDGLMLGGDGLIRGGDGLIAGATA